MSGELQIEEPDSKKVETDGVLRKDAIPEIKKESLGTQTQINYLVVQNRGLRLYNKKCSKSLNDLCKEADNELRCLRRNDNSVTIRRGKNQRVFPYKMSTMHGNNNRIARRRILNLLLLNAWRKQKQEYKAAQEKIESLNHKLEGFEMQVYVLRQLLNAEKKRVETANDNIHELLQKIEENEREKKIIVKENKNFEAGYNNLVDYVGKLETAYRNRENEIITSRREAVNWEKQLEKEREKLKKMENEEIFLKEKIWLNEKVMTLKTQQVDQLTQVNKELKQKLDVQEPIWDETMAQVDLANGKLKEAEIIKNELQKAIEEKDREIAELKSTIASLEKKLEEEDEKNGFLGKSILEKTNELTLIQEKFGELSKSHYPWSGGIIRMASLCAKIPVACICTVGSLLLPFPSYRF